MWIRQFLTAAALAALASAAGCKTEGNDVRRALPGPRLAAATHQVSKKQRYVLGPEADLEVALRLPAGPSVLRLSGLSGFLEFSPLDLKDLQGEVRADLGSLAALSGPLLAAQALSALGVPAQGKRSERAHAHFVVRSVRDVSADAIHLAPLRKGPRGPWLEASLSVLGELELHGYRTEQVVELRLRVAVDRGVPDFRRVDVDTARPARVDLVAHRIQADLANTAGAALSRHRTASVRFAFPLRPVL